MSIQVSAIAARSFSPNETGMIGTKVISQCYLTVMLRGFYQYFALHHCDRKLSWIRHEVQRHWVHALQRRGQRQRFSWVYLSDRPWFELPSARSGMKRRSSQKSSGEPSAGNLHAGFCLGRRVQEATLAR
jgi:hypothetical protein